ncbi:putative Retinol dehydrogenase 13 [Sterolibacterium denitrificans]|uniref:Retinol dehydrogenase 13 n=1 Tax=Sterolibacterium denitrificans TaxID=157592 RepID=A0A7Z7HP17_9PROT|nr:SDR family NAD(P)-dependent oxidoreductase [Sterolibacterium denitrificans]SMB21949.1 putative Retinol dehydrogenase 13 [Sterolibacterium denitrificans]
MTPTRTQTSNPLTATFAGLRDLLRPRAPIGTLSPQDRLDGMTCLITGANSGLGLGTARILAGLGARLILACRSGIPETAELLKRETGNPHIEMVRLDLADFAAIDRCCAELRDRGVKLDRVILNAGVVPPKAIRTAQGFEMMFGVHFLGNMRFVLGLLRDGTIPNEVFADAGAPGGIPRIVCVGSELHRSAPPLDLATLGQFVEYGTMGSMQQYGHSKLAMLMFCRELMQRLQPDGRIQVAVHYLCPGPVDSNIARGTPAVFKPLLNVVKRLLFASPEKAAEPVVYLTAAQAIEGRTDIYLHLMSRKAPAEPTDDAALRRQVWNAGLRMLEMEGV